MENLIEIAISNGIFAGLFVWLLFYQLKDSSNREKRYIDIIDKLSIQLETIEDVKEDVKELKDNLLYKKQNRE
ncbi:MAG: BhlA/UviB family holin-like peptide [Clostridia bacterium]|nr:BhlA/UviB family holin-like peptide [Clostridia bacterium]